MYLAIIKLAEVLARAGFTVGLTFALPLAAAGQFGLVATLLGLFSFAFGWERHIDLQRRLVGAAPDCFDAAVAAMVRLWLVNYALMVPLFAAVLYFWADLTPQLILLALVVAVCDQISNTLYNLAVVEARYRPLVGVVAVKSVALLTVALVLIFAIPDHLNIETILQLWAGISLAMTVPLGMVWLRIRVLAQADAEQSKTGVGVWAQHRASFVHFVIGVLAVLVIQIDRLVVGGLLSPEEAGIFFRHIMLVGFAYQLFNIASFARRMPQILAVMKECNFIAARRIIRLELLLLFVIFASGLLIGYGLDIVTDSWASRRFLILPALVCLMLAAAFVRMMADFQGLILNAWFRERRVLAHQFISFTLTTILLIALTSRFGLFGAPSATLIGAASYFCLNFWAVHSMVRLQRSDAGHASARLP